MSAAWRELDAEHRRWLLLNAVVIAAVVNAVLNALIAWGSAANEDEVPLWAVPLVEGPSLITDTVGTFFILPFLTTLVDHDGGLARAAGREGSRRSRRPRRDPLLSRLPRTRVRRGAYFGLLSLLLFAPPAVVLVLALDYGDISVGDFVLFKAIFGVVLGAGRDAADRACGADGRAWPASGTKWRGPESNRGHHDFQSCALPTELPRRAAGSSAAGARI